MITTYSLLILSSLAPALGALYARRTGRPDFLVALYCVFTVISQIFAAKIAQFDFGFAQVAAPAAVLIFSVTFLLTDVVNERFGRGQTIQMIFTAFTIQAVVLVFSWLVAVLPPAPFWEGNLAWKTVFSLVPRITLASLAVFLVSENFDAFVYNWFRRLTRGRFLWTRNILSTIPALTLDTVLFVTLAFYGTGIPLWPIMVGQFVAKYTVGLLNVPAMYLNRAVLGRWEGETMIGNVVGAGERTGRVEA